MFDKPPSKSWAAILIFCWFLTSCGAAPSPTPQIRVVATLAPLADWARQVGGDRVVITQLVPTGQDPRRYLPSEADLAQLQQADVVLLNGLGLEPWLDQPLDRLTASQVIVLDVAQFIRLDADQLARQPQSPLLTGPAGGREEQDEAVPATAFERPVYSPYLWLNPNNARQTVSLIAQTFTRADPNGWPSYRQAAARTNAEIENLDNRIGRLLKQHPPRAINDLNNFLQPFQQHFRLNTAADLQLIADPAPTLIAVDALLPNDQQIALLGLYQANLHLNPLHHDHYLVLMENLAQTLIRGHDSA